MSSHFPADRVSSMSEDIPAAIPSLIEAAVAAFDTDRDISRGYLLRASALLRVKRRVDLGAESNRSWELRGGLMAWQLNCLLDYIETHLAEKMTAKGLADLVNLSAGWMSRAFKASVGVSPFQYLTRRRVELACTMMSAAQEPLSQIAIACGLCDQAHFCRVFRRVTGMSPTQWRRSIQVRSADYSSIMDVTSAVVGARHSVPTQHSAL
jgi:AraC family transcriptional regulator